MSLPDCADGGADTPRVITTAQLLAHLQEFGYPVKVSGSAVELPSIPNPTIDVTTKGTK